MGCEIKWSGEEKAVFVDKNEIEKNIDKEQID